MEFLLGLLIGLILGALIAVALMRHILAKSKSDMETLREESLNSQKQYFNEVLQKVTEQVKSSTIEMLQKSQKEISDNGNLNIGQIITPLKETIDKMKDALHQNAEKQSAMGATLKTELEHAAILSENARKSAEELSRVFKHGSKVQGDWGETVLNELLNSEGLKVGVHYDTQVTMRDSAGKTIVNENGSLLRPDVILHLDEVRDVIIDSKVSLTSFMDYVNAENEIDKERFLKAHVESIKKHVKELSAKDYSSYIKPPKIKMDFVIMFVPHTGALWTALNASPSLWRDAMNKNVFIADEQTLYSALRMIDLTWKQIAQAQNHQQVFDIANQILDRIGQFVEKYETIGQSIEKAHAAFEDGKKKLSDGSQSVVKSCNTLIKLGAKKSEKHLIPQEYFDAIE